MDTINIGKCLWYDHSVLEKKNWICAQFELYVKIHVTFVPYYNF